MASLSRTALRRLLPKGLAWQLTGQADAVMAGLADSIETVREFISDAQLEAIPATAVETLREWHDALGLEFDPGQTEAQQRARIVAAHTSIGGSSLDYLNAQLQKQFPLVAVSEVPVTPVADITLLGVDGTFGGGSFNNGGLNAILTAGGTIAWSGVDMTGIDKVTMHYSNGEASGDTVQFDFAGNNLGSPMTTINFNAWTGPYTTAESVFSTQTGTGTVRLTGIGDVWVAAVEKIVLSGTPPIFPCDATITGAVNTLREYNRLQGMVERIFPLHVEITYNVQILADLDTAYTGIAMCGKAITGRIAE